MRFNDINYIETIKKRYPRGTRIECDYMSDPKPIPAGTQGTVEMVDDMGMIHMNWDNGRTLALLADQDDFHIV